MKLARAVPCSSPARLGMQSRGDLLLNQVVTVAGVLIGLGMLATIVSPRHRITQCGESRGDIASATVKKYAYEAFPSWHAAHPSSICPRSLLELNEYMNRKDDLDPWGSHYRMYCFVDERGTPSIVVRSFGEDSLVETADDIWSDR